MEIVKNAEKRGFSRRSFMQWAGALSAAAAYGCSGESESDPVVTPQAALVLDKEAMVYNCSHSSHCHSVCMMKLHIKNGRLLKITSAGDITYKEEEENAARLIKPNGSASEKLGIASGFRPMSEASAESLMPMQRRCCIKGFNEIKKIYSPDRLKYPLKQTSSKRGDRTGFVRITWKQACDEIVQMYKNMVTEKTNLGINYLPIWDNGGIAGAFGGTIATFGNASMGGVSDGFWAGLGNYNSSNYGNPMVDMLNSKFIINWSSDMRSNRGAMVFTMTKARDAGIPIVDINAYHTESSAAMATGVDNIPAHISVNPGTDTALQAGMAYVIFKNRLYDNAFIEEHAYGWAPQNYPTLNSSGNLTTAVTTMTYKRTKPAAWTGVARAGTFAANSTYTLNPGDSFVEYLISLEYAWGKVGTGVNKWNNINANDWDTTPVAAGSRGYYDVLAEAERISGVDKYVIEALAKKYAITKPSYICCSFGGASRAQNGMYYTWMLIALSTMCGHINKPGGGPGEVRLNDGYNMTVASAANVKLGDTNPSAGGSSGPSVLKWQISDVVLHGRDFRPMATLTGDSASAAGGVKIKMFVKGTGHSAPLQQSPDLTKNMVVFKDRNIIKHTVAIDQYLSPDAIIGDVILPAAFGIEDYAFNNSAMSASDLGVGGSPLKPLFDSKPDWLITYELYKAAGFTDEEVTRGKMSTPAGEILKAQWEDEGTVIPAAYGSVSPDSGKPSFDDVMKNGNYQFCTPLDKVLTGVAWTPGQYPSQTGYIQFVSPFLMSSQSRAVLGVGRAQYVPQNEGWERVLESPGQKGMEGLKKKPNGDSYTYSLVMITCHAIQRAHAVGANSALMEDLFPNAVVMHPKAAGERGINDGDLVYIYNDNGCIKIPAKLSVRIRPNTVLMGQGAWYRESAAEMYKAYFRNNADKQGAPATGGSGGEIVSYDVPVDVGGAVNSLILGRPCGTSDTRISGSTALPTLGNLVEVSKVHPDKL